MTMKKMLVILTAAIVLCVAGALMTLNRQTSEQAAAPASEATRPAEPVPGLNESLAPDVSEEALPAMPESPAPLSADIAPAVERAAPAPAAVKTPSAPPPSPGGPNVAKEPLRDPLAREALALVGVDPCAGEYWYAAINDPELSAHERQDLIEDLNEDGLSDPRHPSLKDLPVILNRLQIIEVAGPYAMDQVNADAFQEAYKDLVNLANRVFGIGEPVR